MAGPRWILPRLGLGQGWETEGDRCVKQLAASSSLSSPSPSLQSVLPCLFYFLHIHYSYSMSQDSAFGRIWYIYKQIQLLSHKREWSHAICSNMDATSDYYWLKWHRESQISQQLYVAPTMLHKWTCLQNRLTDTESRLVVAQGKGWWKNESGDWDEQVQAILHRVDGQRAPTILHRALYSVCWDKLQWKRVCLICRFNWTTKAGLVTQIVNSLIAMQEIWVWSQGQEDSLEEGLATHSCIFAWRIPRTEKPGGLQSMGSHRVRHDWATNAHNWITAVQQKLM